MNSCIVSLVAPVTFAERIGMGREASAVESACHMWIWEVAEKGCPKWFFNMSFRSSEVAHLNTEQL